MATTTTLASDFILSAAVYKDLDAIIDILAAGWKHDGFWQSIISGCTLEGEHKHVIGLLGRRFHVPNNVFWKLTDPATQYVCSIL